MKHSHTDSSLFSTIHPFPAIFMLWMLLALSCAGPGSPDRLLDEGLSFYRQNQLDEALPFFERTVKLDTQNPDAYAWLAETYRRLGQKEKATSTAQKAIGLNPCHTFAHTVLANAYNPLYSSWEEANADITWQHLIKAAECDSTDGNVWISVWVESIRRGEQALEKKALRLFIETGFLTPTLLAYNRWMLSHLPENALLLTNGDMDTYPAVALQEVEHFRPDVVIVNNSLLNTAWYARYLRDRYDVSLPFPDSELDALRPYQDENGNLVLISNQIFKGWINQRIKGTFPRPIAIAVTVGDLGFVSEAQDHLQFAGPFRLLCIELPDSPLDTTTMRIAITSTDSNDFSGSFVSPQDRSPVRMVGTNRLVTNITATALQYGKVLMDSGHFSEAHNMITWAEQFENRTELGPALIEQIEELKEAARQGIE